MVIFSVLFIEYNINALNLMHFQSKTRHFPALLPGAVCLGSNSVMGLQGHVTGYARLVSQSCQAAHFCARLSEICEVAV